LLQKAKCHNDDLQLAEDNNLKKSFSELKGCAGKEWLNRFLNCHKNIISMTRAEGFNRASVNGFFDILEAELKTQL
jgi:hypothetical protein